MSQPRLRLETSVRAADGRWRIDEREAHHLLHVRRIRDGEEVEGLLRGWRVFLRVERFGDALVALETGREPAVGSAVRVTLFAALLKGEAFDLLLRQATEVGVSTIVPLLCDHSIPRLEQEVALRKYVRWRRILEEATKQCGATQPPALLEVATVADLAVRSLPEDRFAAILDGEARPIADLMFGDDVAFAIGPEGDFSPEEKNRLRELGFLPVSLGSRVLRAPTAAVVGCAFFMLRREADICAVRA